MSENDWGDKWTNWRIKQITNRAATQMAFATASDDRDETARAVISEAVAALMLNDAWVAAIRMDWMLLHVRDEEAHCDWCGDVILPNVRHHRSRTAGTWCGHCKWTKKIGAKRYAENRDRLRENVIDLAAGEDCYELGPPPKTVLEAAKTLRNWMEARFEKLGNQDAA